MAGNMHGVVTVLLLIAACVISNGAMGAEDVQEKRPAFLKLGLKRAREMNADADAVQQGVRRAMEFINYAAEDEDDGPADEHVYHDDKRLGVFTSSSSFVTTLALGTPPATFTAVVDTGSSLVWQQCQPCFLCYKQHGPLFNPSNSATYRKAGCEHPLCTSLTTLFTCDPTYTPPISCVYKYTYAAGGTGGYLAFDTLTLPDAYGRMQPQLSFTNFAFGCGLLNVGNPSNFSGAAGVVGLGRGPTSLISQLSIRQFSYCLQSYSHPPSAISTLYLGPAPPTAFAHAAQQLTVQTPILSNPHNPSPYYIGLKGISVGGSRLRIPDGTFDLKNNGSGGVIVDTGTLPTMLPPAAYESVVGRLMRSIRAAPLDLNPRTEGFDLCFASNVVVPDIVLHLEGGDLRLPTDSYFVQTQTGRYCLVMTASPPGAPTILGSFLQQNVHVSYDLSTNLLSLSPTQCHTLH